MTAFVISAMLAIAAPIPKETLEAEAKFQREVAVAREKAIDFLKKAQTKDGNWENAKLTFLADMKGGGTALVTLALLEAGVKSDDPVIVSAVDYLVKLEPKKTYVVSLQTQVLARADAKKHAKQLQANVDWLLKTSILKDKKLAGWSYPMNELADNSNTHFAVVALHVAAEAGAKVDPKFWQQLRDFYAATQRKDGGWAYYNMSPELEPSTCSMTIAATLGLTFATKHDKDAKDPDPAFAKGIGYLVKDHAEFRKSASHGLFVTAELGRALDTTEFKNGDKIWAWYREGAQKLLKEQKEDGSWVLSKSVDGDAVLCTAFSLYFLGPPPAKK